MSLSADVAVAAAERLEATAGPASGLALWKRLAANAAGPELRGRAILGGIRCGIGVRDMVAIGDLARLWVTVDALSEATWDGVFSACKNLFRAGFAAGATELAHAEVRRSMSARALHAHARCLDVSGDPRAATALGAALVQAEKEGARQLAHACRVRRTAWLARSPETLSQAIDEAKRVVPGDCSPGERLVLAGVLLRSPSRFARATALGLLDDLVAGGGPLADRALLAAARHADDMNDEITPLEVDRLVALLSREPIAKAMTRALATVRAIDRLARAKDRNSSAELEGALDDAARLDPELAALHQRARDILGGRFEPSVHSGAASRVHPDWSSMLDAVVAMRDGSWPRTAHALRSLAESAERGARLPPHVWTVAGAALGNEDAKEDAEVRAVAGRLIAAMIVTTTAAPPHGWLGLAQSLAACGMNDLATTLRRSAALANEPGGADALALTLTRSGWQLALDGERSRAIARLREARALAESHRSPPAPAPVPAGAAAPPEGRPGSASTPST